MVRSQSGTGGSSNRTAFYDKYGFEAPPDKVAGILVPKSQIGEYPIGTVGLIVDNIKHTATYCCVYDVCEDSKGWGSVSIQAAINLGYRDEMNSGETNPSGNFTIYIDTQAMPYYSELKGYKSNVSDTGQTSKLRMSQSQEPEPEYTPPSNSSSQNPESTIGGVNTNGTHGWTTSGTDIQGLIDKIGQQAFGAIEQMMNGLTAYGAASSGQYIMRESINWDYLNYYIVTLDRNSPTPDYKQWKKNNVAGVIVEAGYLYNSAHTEIYYRNPKIHEQCVFAEKSKVPFGLYCICKARSVEEAQKEIYQLSFCIRKYPPVLGMWVRFQLTKSVSDNDKIVDYYFEQLKILGLYGKIGILANMPELKNISWEKKHYKNWVLWLDEHVKDISEVEKLLEPEMFTIGTSKQLEYHPNGVLVGTGTSDIGNKVVAAAKSALGKPYVWGAEGPNSFDCSGLIAWCYRQAGFDKGRQTAQGFYNMCRKISSSQLRPGDMLFRGSSTSSITHCAIFVGNGSAIHAPRTGDVVKYTQASSFPYCGTVLPEASVQQSGGGSSTPVYGGPYVTWRGYKIPSGGLTPTKGRINFNGHTETYYSQRVLPGGGLKIPGRHVASDGTIRDGSNYICVARGTGSTNLPKGTTIMTSLGMGKVYDSGAGSENLDLYTDW